MFPVYILDDKTELPKEGTFYVVARDGIYLSKDTGLIRAMVRVDGISILKELKTKAELRLPKIPSIILAQTLLFFRRVYENYKAEAMVLLYYSKSKNEFMVNAPRQKVGGASVKYEPEGRYEKESYQLIGTIHSHCDFGAFHSGVDIGDEKNFDGIHITIGKVDQPYFTTVSTIVVNNNRFPIEIEKAVIGITKVDYTPSTNSVGYKRTLGVPREESLKYDFNDSRWFDLLFGYESYVFGGASHIHEKPTQFYDLILPDGMDYRNCPFPKEWFERVSENVYYGVGGETTTHKTFFRRSEKEEPKILSTEEVK